MKKCMISHSSQPPYRSFCPQSCPRAIIKTPFCAKMSQEFSLSYSLTNPKPSTFHHHQDLFSYHTLLCTPHCTGRCALFCTSRLSPRLVSMSLWYSLHPGVEASPASLPVFEGRVGLIHFESHRNIGEWRNKTDAGRWKSDPVIRLVLEPDSGAFYLSHCFKREAWWHHNSPEPSLRAAIPRSSPSLICGFSFWTVCWRWVTS